MSHGSVTLSFHHEYAVIIYSPIETSTRGSSGRAARLPHDRYITLQGQAVQSCHAFSKFHVARQNKHKANTQTHTCPATATPAASKTITWYYCSYHLYILRPMKGTLAQFI